MFRQVCTIEPSFLKTTCTLGMHRSPIESRLLVECKFSLCTQLWWLTFWLWPQVKVLKSMEELKLEDVVLGQYTAADDAEKGSDASLGYLDDPTVPAGRLGYHWLGIDWNNIDFSRKWDYDLSLVYSLCQMNWNFTFGTFSRYQMLYINKHSSGFDFYCTYFQPTYYKGLFWGVYFNHITLCLCPQVPTPQHTPWLCAKFAMRGGRACLSSSDVVSTLGLAYNFLQAIIVSGTQFTVHPYLLK